MMTTEEFVSLYPHEPVVVDFQRFAAQRNYIAYEILTSEETYVKSLEIAIVVRLRFHIL